MMNHSNVMKKFLEKAKSGRFPTFPADRADLFEKLQTQQGGTPADVRKKLREDVKKSVDEMKAKRRSRGE